MSTTPDAPNRSSEAEVATETGGATFNGIEAETGLEAATGDGAATGLEAATGIGAATGLEAATGDGAATGVGAAPGLEAATGVGADPGAPPQVVPPAPEHRPAWMPRSSLRHPVAAEGATGPVPPASPTGPMFPAPPVGSVPPASPPSSSPLPPASPLPPPASVSSSPPPTSPSPPAPPPPPAVAAVGEPPPAPASPARAPRWVVPFAICAALALFAGGAMVGWAIAERDAPPAAPTSEPSSPASSGGTGGLVPVDAEEPVAAVAQAVAPSVVQINTDFGLGSGVVMDRDGHILTAAHVIEGASAVRVRLADGTMLDGTVIGTHPETDVGVVKIEPRDDLVPAVLGVDTDVQVGQLAVAVGSPFGLEQSVTSGIVSALDRPVSTEDTMLVGMIQTDASINPGNSGGALADRHGRVIGINDAIRTQGGGNEGVGFAIPIDLASSVADRLISGEPIQMGFLGVVATSVIEGRAGALVREVTPGTAAAEAGVIPGDLVVSINGASVRDLGDLRARVLTIPPGSEVSIVVVRDGAELELEAVIGELQ